MLQELRLEVVGPRVPPGAYCQERREPNLRRLPEFPERVLRRLYTTSL